MIYLIFIQADQSSPLWLLLKIFLFKFKKFFDIITVFREIDIYNRFRRLMVRDK